MSTPELNPLESVPPEVLHRVALLSDVPPGELLIHEIYRSVQGESTFAGLAVRVRPHRGVRLALRLVRHARTRSTRASA